MISSLALVDDGSSAPGLRPVTIGWKVLIANSFPSFACRVPDGIHENHNAANRYLPVECQCAGAVRLRVVLRVFTNLLMLTGPLFMLQVYDRVLGSRSEETLVALTVLLASLYFFLWLLEFARGRVMSRVGARFQSAMGARVFGAVLERAALRRGQRDLGRLQDLEAVRGFFGSPAILALFDAPWTPVFLIAIFIFHPMLGWLAVLGGGLLIAATLVNQGLTRSKNSQANELALEAALFARQSELSADMIWAQGMARSMTGRWAASQVSAIDQSTSASDLTGTFTSFTRAFRLCLQSVMLALRIMLSRPRAPLL
ncbi:ABC transporter transmembrane domain-containing protein [Boseongicola aestuarii]|uniref:Type I secretion system ATP-binding protein PrsD n=1 Tax=Boseongicola aestuarii TaxID=1470561 RepID=A0A238IXU2_9RHOB|nr:ABC transporter transmembrane domain-containing protein [Boseongicola aestuarii]SMX22863.1 Type I secretion system ATP-binding protein PrsD [Boseongicola aestuarii]